MLTHVLVQGRMAQGKRILLIGDSVMYNYFKALRDALGDCVQLLAGRDPRVQGADPRWSGFLGSAQHVRAAAPLVSSSEASKKHAALRRWASTGGAPGTRRSGIISWGASTLHTPQPPLRTLRTTPPRSATVLTEGHRMIERPT